MLLKINTCERASSPTLTVGGPSDAAGLATLGSRRGTITRPVWQVKTQGRPASLSSQPVVGSGWQAFRSRGEGHRRHVDLRVPLDDAGHSILPHPARQVTTHGRHCRHHPWSERDGRHSHHKGTGGLPRDSGRPAGHQRHVDRRGPLDDAGHPTLPHSALGAARYHAPRPTTHGRCNYHARTLRANSIY
jgi:hypothetical protein